MKILYTAPTIAYKMLAVLVIPIITLITGLFACLLALCMGLCVGLTTLITGLFACLFALCMGLCVGLVVITHGIYDMFSNISSKRREKEILSCFKKAIMDAERVKK